MTVSEVISEVQRRSGDFSLGATELLPKINAEYNQTNLAIINLNEDYFLTDKTDFAVTTSLGPYNLPADFGKIRALIPPSGADPIQQANPADPNRAFGWYFSGTVLSGTSILKRISFTDTPQETGNYTLRYVAYPVELDETTNTTPLWPFSFHEILVLGTLKRLYSVRDFYEKYPDLATELKDLRDGLLSQVGGLNLGSNRDVDIDDYR